MSQDLHEQLARYADNELDARERGELEARIAESPELAAEVERWKALRCCAGRAVRDCCVPAAFAARLRDKVNHAGSFSGSRFYRIATVLAAAAAIVLFVVFRTNRPENARPGVMQAGVLSPAALVEVYESCAKKHHEGVKLEKIGCTKSAEALATQVCRGYTVVVPDLTPLGYSLAGMCRCMDDTGVPGLHVYYQNNSDPKELLSVFSISRCTPLKNCAKSHCCVTERDYEVTTIHGVSVLRWDERGGHFALAGELKPEALTRLAAGVQIAAATK
jgi:hypothetical protein